MTLTGDADGPPLAPPAPVPQLVRAAARLAGVSDGAAILGERARWLSLTRHGQVSCGGATRLLLAADGWVAVALPRPEDWAALPAWLGPGVATWDDVASRLASRPAGETCAAAAVLEIPAAAVPDVPPCAPALPWTLRRLDGPARRSTEPPFVVDLSALWAGPLCGALLLRSGARLVKVEDPRRPDGGRIGALPFFRALNAGKEQRVVDLRGPGLARLLESADVVITSGRPRAFEQLGVDVDTVLAASPTVWVAITAYGWSGPERNRVGFGDDVAAGAGLVATHPDDHQPRFAADAVADPLCGALAAAAALHALGAGGSWFIDASLSGAARYAAGLGGTRPTVAAQAGAGGEWWVSVDGLEPVAPPRPMDGPRARPPGPTGGR